DAPVLSACDDITTLCEDETQLLGVTVTGGTGTIDYVWSATSGTFDDNAIAAPTFTPPAAPATVTITVTVTDDNNCSDQCNFDITVVDAPMLSACDDITTLCEDETQLLGVTVTGGTGTIDYSWSATSGTFDDNAIATPTFTPPTTPGVVTVTVTVTDDNNCSDQCNFDITVVDAPVLSACDDITTLCEDETQLLGVTVTGGTGTIDYVWSATSGTFDDNAIAAPTFTPPAAPATVTITVTVTDDNNCSDQCNFDITVVDAPVLSACDDITTLCDDDTQLLGVTVSGGTGTIDYSWSASEGSFDDNAIAAPTFTPPSAPATVTITVTVTDDNNCSDQCNFDITV
ncbi:MAG: hypothetical protein GY841_04990, partial [FCB group bacterium]|nr:hypothetical protein [FCB group bacterium]